MYVCAGTYNESVTIDEPIILYGAQYLTSAVTRYASATPPPETIIDGSGGVTYATGATTGTLSGFTLNSSTTYYEISAANVGSGWTFENNIIDASNGGIYLNTDGVADPSPSTISQNEFIQSTPHGEGGTGYYGSAVALWDNTANNVTISHNDMLNLTGPDADINTTGTASCDGTGVGSSTGLEISHNTFEENGSVTNSGNNFLALFCTTDALVTDNTLNVTYLNDANTESPVFLGGGDITPTISDNVIEGTNAVGNDTGIVAGVKFNSGFYPVDSPTITGNTISGFQYGIYGFGGYGGATTPPTGFTIEDNKISDNLLGIQIDAAGGDPTSGLISGNTLTSNIITACDDTTTGSGSVNTANTWTENAVSGGYFPSAPAGLCVDNALVLSTPPSSVVVGGSSYTPSAIATSRDAVAITIDPSSATVCQIAMGVVSFIGIGTCEVDFSDPGAGAFGAATTSQSFSVGQGVSVITPSTPPSNAVVGGTSYTPTAASTSGNTTSSTTPIVVSLDASSTGCALNSGVVTFTGVGTCVVDFADPGTANYASATTNQSFSVGQGVSVITPSTPPSNAVVGGTSYTPTAASTSGNTTSSTTPIVVSLDASSTGCALNSGVVTFTGVGTCVVDFADPGTANYASATTNQSFSVGQGVSVITPSTPPSNAVVGGTSYTPTAASTSGNTTSSTTPIVVSLDASSTGCALNSGVVTFTGVGTCVVDFADPGTANYASATTNQSFSVGQGVSVITPSTPPSNAVVGGTSYTPTAASTSGNTTSSTTPIVVSLDASSTGCALNSGVVTFTGVGTCVVDFADPGTANYASATTNQSFSVGQGVSVITPSTPPSNAVVGGTSYTPTATSTSGNTTSSTTTIAVSLDASSTGCALNAGVVTFTGVGTCVVDFADPGTANYASATTSQSFSVGQGVQVVTFTAPNTISGTAPSYTDSVTYPGTPYTVAASSDGDGNVTFIATGCEVGLTSGVVTHFDAGKDCVITATAAQTTDYAVGSSTLTISVAQASSVITPSTAPTSVDVGGASYSVSATSSSGDIVSIKLDSSSKGCTLVAGVVKFTAGGTCIIDFSDAGNANYISASASQSITVIAPTNGSGTGAGGGGGGGGAPGGGGALGVEVRLQVRRPRTT